MHTAANENGIQNFRRVSSGELEKARAARKARIAYSTKCAAFRMNAWTSRKVSGEASGKKNSISGFINREVWAMDPDPLPRNKITATQTTSGAYAKNRPRRICR